MASRNVLVILRLDGSFLSGFPAIRGPSGGNHGLGIEPHRFLPRQ